MTCPERLSLQGPPSYGDFVPFAARVVDVFPDWVLWGTDWPHPNIKPHMPDDGHLVNNRVAQFIYWYAAELATRITVAPNQTR